MGKQTGGGRYWTWRHHCRIFTPYSPSAASLIPVIRNATGIMASPRYALAIPRGGKRQTEITVTRGALSARVSNVPTRPTPEPLSLGSLHCGLCSPSSKLAQVRKETRIEIKASPSQRSDESGGRGAVLSHCERSISLPWPKTRNGASSKSSTARFSWPMASSGKPFAARERRGVAMRRALPLLASQALLE